MKIRRYTCNDMQEAMLKVKMELGSEAVIMSSRKVKKKGLFGAFSKPMIEVVAAIDDDYVKPQKSSMTRQAPIMNEGASALYREPFREAPHPSYPQITPSYNQINNTTPYRTSSEAYNQNHVLEENPPIQRQQPLQMHAAVRSESEKPSPDNPKIVELESKVKNMESMLEQIYQAVNDKKETSEVQPKESKVVSPTPDFDSITDLKATLTEYELDASLIEKICDKVRERGGNNPKSEEVFAIAARVMAVLLGEPDTIALKNDGKPQVVIFIGPTGVGKTTTLAKIAADFTLNKQKKVGLITADTYRIAAVEQLKTYAEILNIPVTVVYSPNEIQEAIKKLSDKDLILIDTAGRSHKNKVQFDELKSLVNSVGADEVYLVISANTSKFAVKEVLEYYSFIKSYKMLFTKLDEAPVPSVIINARYMTGRPLSYTTAGQSVPDDLDIASPKAVVACLLGKRSTI